MKGVGVYFTTLIAFTLANLCLCAPTAMECKRVPSEQEYIGIDYMMKAVYLDRGRCLSVPAAEEKSVNNSDYCPGATCIATTTEYVTFNLLNDVDNYLVVKECGLDLSKCSSCKREPQFLKLFAGTPHEQVVDTGRCGGQCSDQQGLSCKATAVRRKAVSGPNGDQTVEVIEQCSCQGDCYRMSYWESYYNRITNDRGYTRNEEKLVDVGRCVGSCTQSPDALCLYRIGGWCFQYQQESCGPDKQSLTKEMFTDRNGRVRSLAVVGECKCQS